MSPTDGTALTFLAVLYGDLGCSPEALTTLAKVPTGEVPSFMAPTVDTFRQRMQSDVDAGAPDACVAATPTTTG